MSARKEPRSERRLKSAPVTTVGSAWFRTAFECAVGDTIGEALQRFSDELRATLDAHESNSHRLSADECLKLVSRLQMRMSVAAEWAERIEDNE